MKRHLKRLLLPAALVLCVILAVSAALAESTLNGLWKSGCDLLFNTHNVTVKGEATFALDGEQFKTMQLHYVQDGYRSYYGLKLLTPRADGSQRETGWTIIADQEDIIVMEAFYPGTYRTATDAAQNTLLRRTVQLDALTELGGLLAAQLEPMLPEGALTAEKTDGGAAVHIALKGDQIPALAVSALNAAAGYLSNRWFSGGYDRAVIEDDSFAFDHYITVTQALTDGTVQWKLQGVDADLTLDSQGRLTGARGEIQVQSVYWDGAAREVAVKFDFTVSDYGASRVKPFNPADYGVELFWDWIREQYGESPEGLDEDAWDEWIGQTVSLLEGQGFPVHPDASLGGWISEEGVNVNITNVGEDYLCTYAEDGRLLSLQNLTALWLQSEEEPAAETDADTLQSAEALIRAFVAQVNPPLAEKLDSLTPRSAITAEDGSRYLTFRNMAQDGAHFVVRVEPSLRMEYFAVTGEE
ncbi:MAG: hypothetical protein J5472_08110 [Clostridia bacterium]|nr:hypothetical protein [Clostridia bacterium]